VRWTSDKDSCHAPKSPYRSHSQFDVGLAEEWPGGRIIVAATSSVNWWTFMIVDWDTLQRRFGSFAGESFYTKKAAYVEKVLFLCSQMLAWLG
jgi:hypothetical protein